MPVCCLLNLVTRCVKRQQEQDRFKQMHYIYRVRPVSAQSSDTRTRDADDRDDPPRGLRSRRGLVAAV